MFMDAVVFGRVDERWDLGPGVAPVRPELAGRMDFVGVNYYFRFRAVSGPAFDILSPLLDFDPTTPLESTPRGISPVLARAAQRWQRPVIMTETGAIQDDTAAGAAWVVQSLDEVRRARAAGVDVRGFYAWTLMDNYEWNQGSRTRMGLYAVDPATKARSIRPSGRAFAEIARARTIPAPLLETYAGFFP
jgi:beta-glucosidase